MKNKIGWCSMTWNPVWGCRNSCSYCYARAIAKRFGGIRFMEEWKYRVEWNMDDVHFKLKNSLDLVEFKPTFLYSQFEKKFPKKPQRIFVGSMSEIAHWEVKWVNKVIFKIFEYPQHIFQFLTRYPDMYSQWDFPQNCWLGVTVTGIRELSDYHLKFYHRYIKKENIKYLSIEPLLGRIPLDLLQFFDWVIIGAETGNRKGKVIPEKQWIWDIINYCQEKNIPVYVKDSIIKLYSQFGGIKEFPEECK